MRYLLLIVLVLSGCASGPTIEQQHIARFNYIRSNCQQGLIPVATPYFKIWTREKVQENFDEAVRVCTHIDMRGYRASDAHTPLAGFGTIEELWGSPDAPDARERGWILPSTPPPVVATPTLSTADYLGITGAALYGFSYGVQGGNTIGYPNAFGPYGTMGPTWGDFNSAFSPVQQFGNQMLYERR